MGAGTKAAAQGRGKISEIELQITQIDREVASEVGRELREIDGKAGEYAERKVAAEDQLRRIDIRAPISGTVHELNVHTVGGVIANGEFFAADAAISTVVAVSASNSPRRSFGHFVLSHEPTPVNPSNAASTTDNEYVG